jgi:endothelin-converting enzyme/putative endopeptidase
MSVSRLHDVVDRRTWFAKVYESSSLYNATTNEITIPAGNLLPPAFDANASDAYNYGAIGRVIGHEMGHALDDQGSQYDAQGRLRNWWSDADRMRFRERTALLVEQYNAYEPLEGHHVNGAATLSENLADLAGLSISYATWREQQVLLQGDVSASEYDFFAGFATYDRAKFRDALLLKILATESHAPYQYRCDGPLRNFEPFYQFFHVSENDKMYLPKTDRVSIW